MDKADVNAYEIEHLDPDASAPGTVPRLQATIPCRLEFDIERAEVEFTAPPSWHAPV